MIVPKSILVECPYCGAINRIALEYFNDNKVIWICDDESMDGCGRYFAVTIGVIVKPTIYKMTTK